MGFVAKDSGGGAFKLAPAGTHLARCYRMIDLGTQEVVFNNETKYQHKIQLSWELHGEDEDGNPLKMDDGAPMSVSKRYTLSLHSKAGLRRDLESWRGKPFTETEAQGFDVTVLLDKWCMLSLIHNAVGDKTYANIASISAVPNAMRKSLPNGLNDLERFDIDDPDMKLFATFHEKLRETIENAPEWKAAMDRRKNVTGFEDMKDDVPEDESLADVPF